MIDTGIILYGVHIPWYRINRKTISSALGSLSSASIPGEKAIANYDEDSITMAVSAATHCLGEINREKITGILFSTTSAPYYERESAAIIGTALNLRSDIRSSDLTGSLKAGTNGILYACDTVKAENGGDILVCCSDCRLGKPGSMEEMLFGDGAAAILIGHENLIAIFEGSYSVSYDFPDYRRLPSDKFVRSIEDRFIREEGYGKLIPEAISGLLKKYKLEPKDINKVAFPCPNLREHTSIGTKLGFKPEQLQQPFLASVGETGTASPLILLAALLEDSQPDDSIVIASYGSGSDALLFKVTDSIKKIKNREHVVKSININQKLNNYDKYLAFRGILPITIFDDVPPTQLPLSWRERKTILSLTGSRCKRCGTPQYPPQRVCANPPCGAIDEMEDYDFANKKATLFTFTEDHASPSPNPPLLFGTVDFQGGGRFVFDLTDCEAGSLEVGMPVEMTFRRKYFDEQRGIVGYFWKAKPVRK